MGWSLQCSWCSDKWWNAVTGHAYLLSSTHWTFTKNEFSLRQKSFSKPQKASIHCPCTVKSKLKFRTLPPCLPWRYQRAGLVLYFSRAKRIILIMHRKSMFMSHQSVHTTEDNFSHRVLATPGLIPKQCSMWPCPKESLFLRVCQHPGFSVAFMSVATFPMPKPLSNLWQMKRTRHEVQMAMQVGDRRKKWCSALEGQKQKESPPSWSCISSKAVLHEQRQSNHFQTGESRKSIIYSKPVLQPVVNRVSLPHQ